MKTNYGLVSSIFSVLLTEKLGSGISAVVGKNIGKEEYMQRLMKAAANRLKNRNQPNISLAPNARERYMQMMKNVASPSGALARQAWKSKRISGQFKFGDTQPIPKMIEVTKESKFRIVSGLLKI